MAGKKPMVNVYVISLKKEKNDIDDETKKKMLIGGVAGGALLSPLLPYVVIATGPVASVGTALLCKELYKKLFGNNLYHEITSQEELNQYVNARGMAWRTDGGIKQIYIAHPKEKKKNYLYEAGAFLEAVEEEEKAELIDFILSKCPAKEIKIDRFELKEVKAGGKLKAEELDIDAKINGSISKGDYFYWKNEDGKIIPPKYDEYLWIDDSLKFGIESLREGGYFKQSFERDFSFGFEAKEANLIGLDVNKSKKYKYVIEIHC